MEYLGYEFPHEDPYDIVQCMSGTETYFYKAVAYCTYHHRYLTEQQMKTKQCRRKQCNRYVRAPFSENYWNSIEEKKKNKKAKKEAQK